MKAVLAAPLALVALAAVSPALAQTAPASAGSDLTRMLNGAPPAATAASASAPAAPASAPARPAAPSTTPSPASAAVATAAPAMSEAAAAEPAPSEPPAWTVLDAPATAALPFAVELPAGFAITEGRPGPDFHVYAIRRGEQPFVMIYVGDYSQFPIYDGQLVQTGGRASIVLTEDGRRIAVEHLFNRPASPSQVHVWLASLDPADRAVAERIGQSVDIR